MYIPELDALIFLATEFLEEGVDQPNLEAGINELHEAAGQQSKWPNLPAEVSVSLSRRQALANYVQELLIRQARNQDGAKSQRGFPGGGALIFLRNLAYHCRSEQA